MLRPLPLWASIVASVLSGFALMTAFPAIDLWPMAFVSIVLLGWALLGRRWWASLLVGLVAGATFWLTLIRWLTLYLGPVPWLALGLLETLFFAVGVALMGLVINQGGRRWSGTWGAYVVVPVVGGAVWASRELFSSNAPYGGFSWGLLAQSQSQSPFTALVAWVGTYGLSFIVAALSLLLVQVLRRPRPWKAAIGWVFVVVALAFVPIPASETTGAMSVLAVQGNSKAGLFDDRNSGDILFDHVAQTLPFAGKKVDAVVWPENAADLDPTRVAFSADILNRVSATLHAPVVTGAITRDSGGTYFNSSLVWQEGLGVQAQFDKIHPVPFAEYMPDRPFWRALAPDLVDLVGYDYGLGQRPNVVTVAGIPVALAICFDISYEQQARDFIAGGAQVVFAQTNNADFGRTDENLQQLAIARLRAVETGRAVVNISTVGTSAVMDSQGKSLAQLPAYEPGAMLTDVPLYSHITPAMAVGQCSEVLLLIVSLVGLLLLLPGRRKP
jgi:apolipoprotein N-acyltransferase